MAKMTAVHSSMRLRSSRLPWGTILKPEFGLGYQKMKDYKIDQTVDRLYQIPKPEQKPCSRLGEMMTADHLSVRTGSGKLPWGTILKPEFGLGYQKMNVYEIEQTVNRLNKLPDQKQRTYSRVGKKMDEDKINTMLERLTKVNKEKIPDHDRRMKASPYKPMGVVSSYAWQLEGYNPIPCCSRFAE